jgi:hypothetical protein
MVPYGPRESACLVVSFRDPVISITLPSTAGPGQARTVIGPDIPAELQAYYENGGAPFFQTVIAAELFYDDNNDYMYVAHVQSLIGDLQPGLAIGSSINLVVAQRFFIDGTTNDTSMSTNLNYVNPTTGDDINGFFTDITTFNGWTNGVVGNARFSTRLVPSPSNSAQIIGRITGGTTTSGIKVGNVAAQFRPTKQIQFPVTNNANATCVVGAISSAGDINVFGTLTGADLSFCAVYPLDLI